MANKKTKPTETEPSEEAALSEKPLPRIEEDVLYTRDGEAHGLESFTGCQIWQDKGRDLFGLLTGWKLKKQFAVSDVGEGRELEALCNAYFRGR